MKYITTADESRSLDREAMTSYGFPEAVLMENAGRDVVSLLRPEIDWKGKSVVVVCGTGNNGGDGFVIARYLCALSSSVAVLLCGNEAHMSETARLYRRIIEKMGIQVIPVSEDTDWETPLESADVIVDALIGTGLSREVTGVKAEVIEMMNASRASVVSVDVPSGLSSDTGEPMGLAVMANYTVALESYKRCHVLSPGHEYCGKVLYSAIGLPAAVGRSLPVSLIEEREVGNLLPVRERMCHKGKNGFIGISRKVKEDGGPAIYGHERIGKGGKPFKCLKFRSMVINSKEVLEELLLKDVNARKEWEETFKLKNDPRVTKIGAFLRRTSLDELPQLFNVLKGEMSLVGPRPIITAELERYNEEVDYYLLSKPGMTGLWQVSGRSDVDYETRVYLDAWYVKNWSMWNDIAILFKTIGVVLKKDGAY